jgi:nucleotide-binding universal stress UspA family protein
VLMVKTRGVAVAPAEEHRPEPGHHARAARPIPIILHPTDFSAPSDEAFRMASMLAEDRGARLIVMHVAARAVPGLGMVAGPALHEDYEGAVEARLRRLQVSAPRVRLEYRVEEGNAAVGILDAARATGCELIVMGTHGRIGLERVLMDSVAEKVIRTAPCPVMAVTTPLTCPPPSAPPPRDEGCERSTRRG